MALNKPQKTPIWNTGGANRTTPTAPKIILGWEPSEAPSSGHMNWLQHHNGQILQWLFERWFDGATADNLTISAPASDGTGAGTLSVRGSEPATSGDGGPCLVSGGDAVNLGVGGDIDLGGGNSGGANTDGSETLLSSGQSTGNAVGFVSIRAAEPGVSGSGVNTPTEFIELGENGVEVKKTALLAGGSADGAALLLTPKGLTVSASPGGLIVDNTFNKMWTGGGPGRNPVGRLLDSNLTLDSGVVSTSTSKTFSQQYTFPANFMAFRSVFMVEAVGYGTVAYGGGSIETVATRIKLKLDTEVISNELVSLFFQQGFNAPYRLVFYVQVYGLSSGDLQIRVSGSHKYWNAPEEASTRDYAFYFTSADVTTALAQNAAHTVSIEVENLSGSSATYAVNMFNVQNIAWS